LDVDKSSYHAGNLGHSQSRGMNPGKINDSHVVVVFDSSILGNAEFYTPTSLIVIKNRSK